MNWITEGSIEKFEKLERNGMFSPSLIPQPEILDNGCYFLELWDSAIYLENMSKNMVKQF